MNNSKNSNIEADAEAPWLPEILSTMQHGHGDESKSGSESWGNGTASTNRLAETELQDSLSMLSTGSWVVLDGKENMVEPKLNHELYDYIEGRRHQADIGSTSSTTANSDCSTSLSCIRQLQQRYEITLEDDSDMSNIAIVCIQKSISSRLPPKEIIIHKKDSKEDGRTPPQLPLSYDASKESPTNTSKNLPMRKPKHNEKKELVVGHEIVHEDDDDFGTCCEREDSDDCRNPRCIEFDDGTIYRGGIVGGKMHGYGKLTYPDGGYYEGPFNNGIRGDGFAYVYHPPASKSSGDLYGSLVETYWYQGEETQLSFTLPM